MGIEFFLTTPDLPQHAHSVEEIAEVYRKAIGNSGKLVEIAIINIDGCQSLRTIISVAQQPSGLTYVGAVTIPFRDFSFVVKCQCVETGATGIKEAILLDRNLANNGSPKTSEDVFDVPDYDPDAEVYDAEFPMHPVARVRRILNHVAGSLVIDNRIKPLPRFTLPV
jgi:hypothetical protein